MARNKQQNDAGVPELQERVVYINRVSKVVKGGRRFALTALVVVGDGNGRVGVGMGKSQEVPIAIKKGVEDAKKNMFTVPLTAEKTLPHEILGEYGAGRVLIKPATPGTGVIAGGPVRAIMELAGVTDVLTKSLGTNNAMNIVKAAAEGLKNMQSPQEVAARRNMSGRPDLRLEGERIMAEAKKIAAPHAGEKFDRPPGRSGQDAARAGLGQDRPHGRPGGQRERPWHDLQGEASHHR